MQSISTVTSKGQVVIPKPIRDLFLVKPFAKVFFSVQNKKVILSFIDSIDDMRGVVKTNKKYSDKDFDLAVAEEISQKYKKKKNKT